ncbi:MAG TPA: hypothetical protein VN929_09040 [Burkholderiales bacterium]|nr:hypothetical protein [Burkholderiales bacterium]
MKIKITLPDGAKVEGDDGKEVGEAARAYIGGKRVFPAALPEKPKLDFHRKIDWSGPDVIRAVNGYDVAATTLELLEAIKAAGNRGLGAGTVQKIVHADTAKGIGGRMVRINGYLRRLGFLDAKELFDNPKDRKTGARVWKPKEKLDAAIDAARKAVKG